MNRGYFGGDDSKPTPGANRDVPGRCRSSHLPKGHSSPLRAPSGKKHGTLNSRLGSLPGNSQARNSWLGWQSGTFCQCRLHVRGAALKISRVPAPSPCCLPRARSAVPPWLREVPQRGRSLLPSLSGLQGEVGNRWKELFTPFSPSLTPLHAAGEVLLRKKVVLSGKPPSNRGCGTLGCV